MNSKPSIYTLLKNNQNNKVLQFSLITRRYGQTDFQGSLLEHVALLACVPLQQHAIRGGRVGQDTEGLPLPVQCPLLVFQDH